MPIMPWGGGTAVDVGAAPPRAGIVLGLRRLGHLLEHEPGDLTVTAEAGMTIADLQTALRARGQWLSLDPPDAERATLGGVVAANASGPRRQLYGTVRDLLIGVTVVTADGSLVRGGGKVVKNVAGYDLPKLFVGSLRNARRHRGDDVQATPAARRGAAGGGALRSPEGLRRGGADAAGRRSHPERARARSTASAPPRSGSRAGRPRSWWDSTGCAEQVEWQVTELGRGRRFARRARRRSLCRRPAWARLAAVARDAVELAVGGDALQRAADPGGRDDGAGRAGRAHSAACPARGRRTPASAW